MIVLPLTLSLMMALTPISHADGFPRGEIVENITCTADPEQTYALYLPTSYEPGRKWPVLYAFDPRARAGIPATLFQEAAERNGWIIVSSGNSMSDTGMMVNVDALRALWVDTRRRFSIDEDRVYLAGFSGTARFCMIANQLVPVRGVIGVGGAFPTGSSRGLGFGWDPPKEIPYVYFGSSGNLDFNYYEMRELDGYLDDRNVRHLIEHFDGPHSWPPAELCSWAIDWMEIQAIRDEVAAKNAVLVQTRFEERLTMAQGLEKAGKPADAYLVYQSIVRDFDGLGPDLQVVRSKEEFLGSSRAVTSILEARKDKAKYDLQTVGRAASRIARAISPETDYVSPRNLIRDLDIGRLKKVAANTRDIEDSLAAQRILAAIQVNTTFYLPRALFEKGDLKNVILVLKVAEEITPESAMVHFGLARAFAGIGDKKKALSELEKAVDLGIRDPELVEEPSEFDAIRGEKRFVSLIAGLREGEERDKN